MEAHRVETTVQPNGTVLLENLPFEDGETVEVIVLETNTPKEASEQDPLKGTLLKYDDPFGPAVPPEDWEALR